MKEEHKSESMYFVDATGWEYRVTTSIVCSEDNN